MCFASYHRCIQVVTEMFDLIAGSIAIISLGILIAVWRPARIVFIESIFHPFKKSVIYLGGEESATGESEKEDSEKRANKPTPAWR